jgi:glucokinase
VLLADVRGVLQRWAATSEFLASLQLPDRVALVPKHFPAAAVGAALVGVDAVPAPEAAEAV